MDLGEYTIFKISTTPVGVIDQMFRAFLRCPSFEIFVWKFSLSLNRIVSKKQFCLVTP